MNDETKDAEVDLFEIDRPCQGKFDKSQLALKEVDATTKHYSKKILLLKDAEVTRLVKAEEGDPDYYYSGVTRTYYLGLELRYRQEWKPSGYGLGELINSLSLLPNEELTLEVKTWETSKTQQDEEKKLDSKNISDVKVEKSDVREILDDYQEKTHHEFDAHASASWGWGSASANYGFSNDVQQQHKTLSKYAQDVARKSVNEISCKRSIKMSVSRETGSEDKTTRKIKNINQCRTLNVNYFQVLREYEVSIYLDSVNLLLFGPWEYKETWDNYVKWKWNLESIMMQALKEQSLDTNGDYFLMKVAPHVIPRPDAMQITNEKNPRAIYAYEIIPGFENGSPKGLKDLLDYLFSYMSTSSPPPHMKALEIVKESDFLKAKNEGMKQLKPVQSAMLVPLVHYLSAVEIAEFGEKINSVNDKIVADFLSVTQQVGQVQTEWKETIPTHGIYAETMLGLCSGCEDYYEIQRQFDLEQKKIELEKLKLEVEQLKLENQALAKGKPDVLIKNPTDKTTLNLNINAEETPIQVDIEEKNQ